jgi:hypothetical protein
VIRAAKRTRQTVYGAPLILLRRVLEASGRWPAPRADSDLTHNPEIASTRSKHSLEQCTRQCALP